MSRTYKAGSSAAVEMEPKDPAATLDYSVDWSSWLQAGEAIASHTVTVPTWITKDSDSEAAGVVTAWLSGGTVGRDVAVVYQVTTNSVPARTDERTMIVPIRNR